MAARSLRGSQASGQLPTPDYPLLPGCSLGPTLLLIVSIHVWNNLSARGTGECAPPVESQNPAVGALLVSWAALGSPERPHKHPAYREHRLLSLSFHNSPESGSHATGAALPAGRGWNRGMVRSPSSPSWALLLASTLPLPCEQARPGSWHRRSPIEHAVALSKMSTSQSAQRWVQRGPILAGAGGCRPSTNS